VLSKTSSEVIAALASLASLTLPAVTGCERYPPPPSERAISIAPVPTVFTHDKKGNVISIEGIVISQHHFSLRYDCSTSYEFLDGQKYRFAHSSRGVPENKLIRITFKGGYFDHADIIESPNREIGGKAVNESPASLP
jgi:hypothetical protein